MNNQPSPSDEMQKSKEKGHEIRDVNVSRVILYGFGMLVVVVVIGIILSAVVYKNMGWFMRQDPATPQFQATSDQLPPMPRLEVRGWKDMDEFRAAEQKQLESYGWVDKDRKIVRIPIEKAMELTARKQEAK